MFGRGAANKKGVSKMAGQGNQGRKPIAEQRFCELAQAITALTELTRLQESRIEKVEKVCRELQQKLE